MTPIATYDQRVESGELTDDTAQRQALVALQNLHEQLVDYKPKSKWLLSGLFGVAPPRPKGLYMYGGVGRGKSMLMDLFFDTAPIKRKRRVHFHAFMQEIQDSLHAVRKTGVEDAIKPVAQKIIADASLLCFDEMQITDIADAMIVGRLFEHLFEAGVIVVTTSNRHPTDLYKNGLNRQLFVPFIDLIQDYLLLHNLDSETDHRQNRLAKEQLYFTPHNDAAQKQIDTLWADLSGGHSTPLVLKRKGREITLPFHNNSTAMASFDELCGKPLGPGDYLEIAKSVKLLIVTNIPALSSAKNNEAKRFVTLIDALYEAKTKLIASAATEPEQLYTTGRGAFEFERTASRLREMQSADWGNN
ncbi:cell division protein ZapE [Paramylibacter kogurei]|nr:cell division protein ZapE [Amylibacter kogurei]